ncbi:uracil-DNA glycosylase family protein [Haloprofundus sp. MHR1]|uniref:uracil-DNA glycosylase n=1 Tax=Haloprofundus sp. MHR1 TaxID=2572921 RepID=UPI0010BEBE70|nr:uracil-DNA glycosylase family protein [Haloprofundus sp. MHR1]QCJ47032.1 uracil-DNA glycosylase [Haloprofundus sp. MHR1]
MPTHPDESEKNVLEPGCARCPALVESRTCISWGNGPTDADVVVVGEAPGAGDPDADIWKGGNHTGFAYTSKHSGRRIRSLFESLGYADRTYYTNAVNCFPEGEDGSNREPTPEERRNCRVHLETELEAVSPDLVVTTGRHATATLLAFDDERLDGFLDRVLEPFDSEALDVRVLPLLHPSYQEVWLSRLGYTAEAYRDAIAEHLP